ncbi:MAG: hypothetical protein NTU88_00010 [Armatimonadetes bacterium]|nr:hypothetical protein [Armatimonadota bacterium]
MRSAKLIAAGCAAAFLLSGYTAGWAAGPGDSVNPLQRDEVGYWRSLAAAQSKAFNPQERGVSAGDSIRGNGGRAGYSLSHGGVIPNSDSVTVDSRLLSRNTDYYLDSASGMLAFAASVRVHQLIRVNYRYSPEKDKERAAVGAQAMALNFGPKNSVGITFAQTATSGTFDLLTYGVNLKSQLGAKSNMNNLMYVSSARDSGRVALNLTGNGGNKAPVQKPKTDSIFVHDSNLQTGRLSVKVNYQDVGKDFSGFSTLRQQKAAADDVLGRLEKEKGLRRLGIQSDYSLGHGLATGLSWSQIGDVAGSITKQSLTFGDSRMKISADLQQISEGFTSLKQLTAAEQGALAKEIGIRRMNLLGDFKLGTGLQLKTSFAQVSAKDSGLSKYGLSLAGKQFSVTANLQDIDPNFSRIADLADADKKTMVAEQGMRRYDLTTHFTSGNVLTVDSFLYDAKHKTSDVFKRQLKNNIVIAPSHGPKLSILRDELSLGTGDASSRSVQQRFIVEHRIGPMALNAMQDTVTREDPAGIETRVQTRTLHFDTDPKLRTSLVGDWKNVMQDSGKFEDTKTLRLSTKLTPRFDFTSLRIMIQTDTNQTQSQEFSLVGKVLGNVALKSRFGETRVDGDVSGTIRELSLVPDAPKDYGPFKQAKWSFGFGEVQRSDKIENQAKSGRLESQFMDQKIVAEYSGSVTKDGQRPITRSFGIAGDPDPKKPVHYNFMYKVRDPGAGEPMLIRRYDFDWQINASTRLTYNYFTFNEKLDGKIENIGGERIRLTTPFMGTLSFLGQMERTEDYTQNIDKDTLSLGVSGKLSALTAFEASCGFNRVLATSGETSSLTYRLKYDQQVDADHFLTLSGKLTNWAGPHPVNPNEDDVTVQLDFRTIFG